MRLAVFTLLLVGTLVGSIVKRSHDGWDLSIFEQHSRLCERKQVPESCLYVGEALMAGDGVTRNAVLAAAAFQSACRYGSAKGCFRTGQCFENGTGVAQNRADALALYGIACISDEPSGCVAKGRLLLVGNPSVADVINAEQLLETACDEQHEEGCLQLGLHRATAPWAATQLEGAATALQSACDLGSDEGCVHTAWMLACGHGREKDLDAARTLFVEQCAADSQPACAQLLAFERDAGVSLASAPSMQRALLEKSRELALEGDSREAVRLAAPLDGGFPRLLDISLALDLDQLDRAAELLAEAPAQIEFEVLRHVLAERRRGTPWPDAQFVAWGRAGRPDLRTSPLVGTNEAPSRFRAAWLACRSAPPPAAVDELLVLTRGESVISDALAERALNVLRSRDEVLQLAALSVLGKSELPTTPLERAVRDELAHAHPESFFFQLVRLVPRAHETPTPEALQALSGLDLEFQLPGRQVFERLAAAHTEVGLPTAMAFSPMVGVLSGASNLTEVTAWLRSDVVPARVRARTARILAHRFAAAGWLLTLFLGASLAELSHELSPDPETAEFARETRARAERLLRVGGLYAVGNWPLRDHGDAQAKAFAESEVQTIERLLQLAEGARP